MTKIITVLAVVVLLASGCTKTQNAALPLIIDDFKALITASDEKLGLFEEALNAVEAYIQNPSDDLREAAISKCRSSVKTLSELTPVTSSLDENVKKQMPDIGIDIIDYNEMFNVQQAYTDEYMENLASLIFYLENGEDLYEQSVLDYNFKRDFNDAERKLFYIGINYIFSDVTDTALEDFKNFLKELKYLNTDSLPWETDKSILDAKAERCLVEMEKALNDFSQAIGDEYLQLTEIENIFKETLSELGYNAQEVKEILNDIYSESKDPNVYIQNLIDILTK